MPSSLQPLRNPHARGLISDAVTALEKERFDVVLLDLNLPDGRGVECVERVREADDLIPIVVLSGQGDEISPLKS